MNAVATLPQPERRYGTFWSLSRDLARRTYCSLLEKKLMLKGVMYRSHCNPLAGMSSMSHSSHSFNSGGSGADVSRVVKTGRF